MIRLEWDYANGQKCATTQVEGRTRPQSSGCDYYFVTWNLDQIAFHFIPCGTQENPISHLRPGLHRGIHRPELIDSDLPSSVSDSLGGVHFKVRTNEIHVKYLVGVIIWLWNEVVLGWIFEKVPSEVLALHSVIPPVALWSRPHAVHDLKL